MFSLKCVLLDLLVCSVILSGEAAELDLDVTKTISSEPRDDWYKSLRREHAEGRKPTSDKAMPLLISLLEDDSKLVTPFTTR